MKNTTAKHLTVGGLIGACYVALSVLQNLLVPGSASMVIQFRVAEALCVLAFFTPDAIAGLCVGCAAFNLIGGATPVDVLLGTLATGLAAAGMYGLRRYPIPGLLLPAVCNGLLIGWELSLFLGYGFWYCAGTVAFGEATVLFALGLPLWYTLQKKNLSKYLR